MEDKSCTSSETGQHFLMPNVQLAQLWTKSLKHMPNFTHTHIEKHLILEKEKLPDKISADALKHKKDGYILFKAEYVTKILVKSNIKKGDDFSHFLVHCQVNAEMKKQDYEVYVHLNQVTRDIVYAKC